MSQLWPGNEPDFYLIYPNHYFVADPDVYKWLEKSKKGVTRKGRKVVFLEGFEEKAEGR